MDHVSQLAPRQIWADPTTTTTRSYAPGCTPVVLPSDGMWFTPFDVPAAGLGFRVGPSPPRWNPV